MALICLLGPCVATAYGQGSIGGAILDTVTDPAGALVPGAAVTITHTATRQARSLETNAAGYYDFEAVEVGIYDTEDPC